MSDINDLKVTNFKCSEHGSIKPVPRCPKCIETERTDERSESQSIPPHPHWGERLLEIAKTKNTLHSISMKTGEFSLLPEVVQVITETLATAIQKEREDISEMLSAMKWDEAGIEDGSEFMTPRDYRKRGHNSALSEAVVAILKRSRATQERPKHHE